ncbi:MAG: FAD-dependent oxidoreductase [Acidobacteriota bacterium]
MTRHVILVGGGHSHVQVLEALASDPLAGAKVKVVVDKPIAIYSGMVPGYVAGQYRADELEIDVPALCRHAGVDVIVETVEKIDAHRQLIHVAGHEPLSYDFASLNIGSTVAGLDTPGIRAHAIPTRPISDLVSRVDSLVSQAAARPGQDPFRVIVVGGGAGGIELAFTFRERLIHCGAGPVATTLVHAGAEILEGYPDSLARKVHRLAEPRDIDIVCTRRVTAAEPHRVLLDNGIRLPFDALIWVTGAVSHALLSASGLPVEDRGFVEIRSTLQVEGFDNLFAVGDCATLIDYPKTPKAGVYAVRQGPYLTANLRAVLEGRPLEIYRPQSDFLTLLNLGDGTALGAKWGRSFHGKWVMRLKDWIDQRFMQRFRLDT